MSAGRRDAGPDGPRDPDGFEGSVESREPRNLDSASQSLERRYERTEDARAAGMLRGQRARSWTERFLTRATSGIVYTLIIFACLFWGRFPTAVLVSLMSWLCCSEFFRIVRMGGRMPNELSGLAAALLYPLAALARSNAVSVVTLLLMLSVGLWYVMTPRAAIADVAVTVFGSIYTGLLFSSVVTIRLAEADWRGGLLTLGVMGSVWVNDAAAYLVGSRLGRHKLAPRISPNKSIEGMLGGLAGSVGIWFAMLATGALGITAPIAVAGGVLCGIAGVAGDLFESRLKRAVGVKDSGNLIPGHGGLLDRSDSMLFACMTAYFVLHIGGIL